VSSSTQSAEVVTLKVMPQHYKKAVLHVLPAMLNFRFGLPGHWRLATVMLRQKPFGWRPAGPNATPLPMRSEHRS
jgi:hypothetical protein